MRILLVSAAFAPVVSAHSERAVSLARLLRRAGHEVHVLRLDTEYGAIAPGYEPGAFCDAHIVARTGIHRHIKAKRALKPLRLLLDLLTAAPGPFIYEARRMRRQVAEDFASRDYDVVWVTTPPQELQLVGYWLSSRYGIPYVMDLRDPWGESTRLRWVSPLHKRLAQRAYVRCLEQAAAVVANTPQHFDLIRRWHGSRVEGKLHLVPNGYFEEDFAAIVPNGSSPPDVPLLTYAGNLYGGLVEESLLPLYEAGSSRDWKFRIRIVGSAAGNFPFEYAGVLPPSRVASEIVAATWLFLYMPPAANTGPVMSLKAYQYARSGKPILYYGPKNETYDYLSQRSPIIDYDDPERAVDGLLAKLGHVVRRPPTEMALNEGSWEARYPLIEGILRQVVPARRQD